MSREPKVWLLQESWKPDVDMSSAQRYGTVIPILTRLDVPGQAPGPCLFKLKHALRDYHPDDYVTYALSDPAAPFLAGMVFANEGLLREPVNWLRWDRERDINSQRTKGGYYIASKIEYR